MKRQVIDQCRTPEPGQDKGFERIVWALVSFSLFLFGLMVGTIAYGYLQFSG